jgi:hypothetical protein
MTITSFHEDGDASCRWFVEGEPKMACFPVASLIETTDRQQPEHLWRPALLGGQYGPPIRYSEGATQR